MLKLKYPAGFKFAYHLHLILAYIIYQDNLVACFATQDTD